MRAVFYSAMSVRQQMHATNHAVRSRHSHPGPYAGAFELVTGLHGAPCRHQAVLAKLLFPRGRRQIIQTNAFNKDFTSASMAGFVPVPLAHHCIVEPMKENPFLQS